MRELDPRNKRAGVQDMNDIKPISALDVCPIDMKQNKSV